MHSIAPGAQKALYFQTGEQTTGTLGPKALEFQGRRTAGASTTQWRDSYKTRDVAKAKALLADLGLKDTNNDGYVEFPDGSKFTRRHRLLGRHLHDRRGQGRPAGRERQGHRPADGAEPDLAGDLRRPVVGRTAHVAHQLGGEQRCEPAWSTPQWLVPIENARWAPLEGSCYAREAARRRSTARRTSTRGNATRRGSSPRPAAPSRNCGTSTTETKREPDDLKRTQLVWEMIKIHITGGRSSWGTVADFPNGRRGEDRSPERPEPREPRRRAGFTNTVGLPCPACLRPGDLLLGRTRPSTPPDRDAHSPKAPA